MLKPALINSLLIVSLASLTGCKLGQESATKIVGGNSGGPEAVVKISNGRSTCSGTFIHKRELLTAWHCLGNTRDGGISYNGNRSTAVFLQATTAFPANPSIAELGRLMPNDVALVRFSEDIAPAIATIGSRPSQGATVKMVGFGLTEMGNSSTLGSKNQGDSIVREYGKVVVDAKGNRIPTAGLITTEGRGVYVQGGDSGGALFHNNQLVGVTSAGPEPDDPLVSLFVDLSTSSSQAVLANRLKTDRNDANATAQATDMGACFIVAKTLTETDKRFCARRQRSQCTTTSNRHNAIFINARTCESFTGKQQVTELRRLARANRDQNQNQNDSQTQTPPSDLFANATAVRELAIKVKKIEDYLLVAEVTEDGLGEKSGLRRAMKITQLDGTNVSTVSAFSEAITAANRAERDIELKIRDRAETIKVDFDAQTTSAGGGTNTVQFGEFDPNAPTPSDLGRCYVKQNDGRFTCSKILYQKYWCKELVRDGVKVKYWKQGSACEAGTINLGSDSNSTSNPLPMP